MMQKRGFTLIELIVVIAIIAILAVPGAWLMTYIIQNSVFIPNKLNMDMTASDALRIMVEGDSQAKGLRFSRAISSIPNTNQITFINQDSQSISYRLDTGTNRLYRSIAGGPESPIPYYVSSGINLTGKSGALFTYYDAGEGITSNPANVRRVAITLIARTGTGSYSDWQGLSEQSSCVAVNKYQ
jgi:prepilin-type N-terminal cleavage/methylation domain-containing protein